MRIKMAAGLLAGSVLVHVVTTACTAVSEPAGVKEAAADTPDATSPAAPEVSDAPCTSTYEIATPTPPFQDAGSTRTVYFAEHAYPGKSKYEIAAHVSHWTVIGNDPSKELRPPAYAGGLNLQSALYTRDGFAGAGCQQGTTTYFIYRP